MLSDSEINDVIRNFNFLLRNKLELNWMPILFNLILRSILLFFIFDKRLFLLLLINITHTNHNILLLRIFIHLIIWIFISSSRIRIYMIDHFLFFRNIIPILVHCIVILEGLHHLVFSCWIFSILMHNLNKLDVLNRPMLRSTRVSLTTFIPTGTFFVSDLTLGFSLSSFFWMLDFFLLPLLLLLNLVIDLRLLLVFRSTFFDLVTGQFGQFLEQRLHFLGKFLLVEPWRGGVKTVWSFLILVILVDEHPQEIHVSAHEKSGWLQGEDVLPQFLAILAESQHFPHQQQRECLDSPVVDQNGF